MFVFKILLGFISNNIRGVILVVTALFSFSGIYYGINSFFERRAAMTIIKNQSHVIKRQRLRCNQNAREYLQANINLEEELSNVQHEINNNKNIDAWSNEPLPSSIKRLLAEQ